MQTHSKLKSSYSGLLYYLKYNFGFLSSNNWINYCEYYCNNNENPLKHYHPFIQKILLNLPFIAIPTVFLFFIQCLIYIFIIWLSENEYISTFESVFFITLTMFTIFTPGHDAAHGSISSSNFINGLIGRIAFELLGPIAVFCGWRVLHLRHHKFTNDPDKDPDRYACGGYSLLLPLRWLTTIPQYCICWLCLTDEKGILPLKEKIEVTLNLAINFAICIICYDIGLFYQIYFYWMLPSFFCHGLLVFAFDFLPHYQHSITPKENRYKTTSNIETYSILQPILSIILHYQNYHVLHHLYPTIPFYRYKAKWYQKLEILKEQKVPIIQLKFKR